jgi:hypothetical protein
MRVCLSFFVIFIPLITPKSKRIFYFSILILLSLYSAIILDARLDFIYTILISFLFLVSIRKKAILKIAKIFYLTCLLFPLVNLAIGIQTGYSLFEISESLLFLKNEETGRSTDTRTFLYSEVLTDLSKHDALILGKGISGRIATMLSSSADPTVEKGERQFLEITFLEYMRRGGIIYTLLMYSIMLLAAYFPLKHAQNSILLYASMSIMIFFLTSFIGHDSIFSIQHVFLWIIIGICSSKKWNKLTDVEIKSLVFPKMIKR